MPMEENKIGSVEPSQFLPALCAKHTAGGPNSDFKGINQNMLVCLFRFVHICSLYLCQKPEMPKTWRKIPKRRTQKKIVWRKILK